MCDREHERVVLMVFEREHLGKPLEDVAPNQRCTADQLWPRRIRLRRMSDALERRRDFRDELAAPTVALFFIPERRAAKLGARFRM